jgi:hypothetical protein
MKRDCVALRRTANNPISFANCKLFRNVCPNPKGLGHCTFAKKGTLKI